MYISYNEFCDLLSKSVTSGDDFYLTLLETMIDDPYRYVGLFRLTNAKTKLVQNVTQSNEIKFGDFIEDLTTLYLDKLGYKNYNKILIASDSKKDRLNCDQLFSKGDVFYLVEQKMRDDHDSTKKVGQFQNFLKKINAMKTKYKASHYECVMWFVDDGKIKNKNYYLERMKEQNITNTSMHLFYGDQFFKTLDNGIAAWNEIIEFLTRYKKENAASLDVEIENFGSSPMVLKALLRLPLSKWAKLISNEPIYRTVRDEFFSDGENLNLAKQKRRF